jgi:hypothetical protein
MNNLAVLFKQQGRHTEAEILLQQTLKLKKAIHGDDHPLTLNSMKNLVEVIRQQGKFVEAEALQRQMLELIKVALGDSYPSISANTNKLTIIFFQ